MAETQRGDEAFAREVERAKPARDFMSTIAQTTYAAFIAFSAALAPAESFPVRFASLACALVFGLVTVYLAWRVALMLFALLTHRLPGASRQIRRILLCASLAFTALVTFGLMAVMLLYVGKMMGK